MTDLLVIGFIVGWTLVFLGFIAACEAIRG